MHNELYLNKTDGTLLVTPDGSADTTSTDITLVGRNYKGFGEFINENCTNACTLVVASYSQGNYGMTHGCKIKNI